MNIYESLDGLETVRGFRWEAPAGWEALHVPETGTTGVIAPDGATNIVTNVVAATCSLEDAVAAFYEEYPDSDAMTYDGFAVIVTCDDDDTIVQTHVVMDHGEVFLVMVLTQSALNYDDSVAGKLIAAANSVSMIPTLRLLN